MTKYTIFRSFTSGCSGRLNPVFKRLSRACMRPGGRAAWLICIAAASLLAACENDLERVNTISSKLLEVSVETSKGIEITYSDSARVKAVLESPLLLSYQTEEPYDLMPEGLKVTFYDDSLQVQSTLTAKYGRRNLEEKTIEVRDSVVVISSDGRKLETERLVWEEEGDRIFSDKFVKITSNGDITQGIGLETNSKFSPYKILDYSGTIRLKDNSADSAARTGPAGPGTPPGTSAGDTSGGSQSTTPVPDTAGRQGSQ